MEKRGPDTGLPVKRVWWSLFLSLCAHYQPKGRW